MVEELCSLPKIAVFGVTVRYENFDCEVAQSRRSDR